MQILTNEDSTCRSARLGGMVPTRPPSGPDDKPIVTAPFSQWTDHHTYDTAAHCEARRLEIIDALPNSELDAIEYFQTSLCVSADDPRLNQKE